MKLPTLNKSAEFKAVLSLGNKFYNPCFNLFYMASEDTRFGFVASKRFFKRAVDRNKAKRKIRKYVQENKHHLNFPELSTGHYIFILKDKILTTQF